MARGVLVARPGVEYVVTLQDQRVGANSIYRAKSYGCRLESCFPVVCPLGHLLPVDQMEKPEWIWIILLWGFLMVAYATQMQ